MAQSKTEKKLAELLKGKLCYKKSLQSILLDTNEYGIITLDKSAVDFRPKISFYERTDETYLDNFNRYVIDDDLDNFKKTGKLFTRSIDNDFYLELFKNEKQNLSICLDRTGWLFLLNLNAGQVNYYIDKYSTKQDSKDQYKNIYNKAKNYLRSKEYALQCLKEHLGYTTSNLIKLIREKFALRLAEYNTSKHPTRSQYAQKEAFKSYYEKLRSSLSKSQLQLENQLLEELYSKYIAQFLQNIQQQNQLNIEKDIQAHKMTIFYSQNVQKQIEPLEEEILFRLNAFSATNFSKIIFTCDYGFVIVSDNKLQFITADSASFDFITQKKYHIFKEEFSSLHAIGQYFLNPNNKYDFLLFDNGKYCIYLEGDKQDIKIDTHASFYRRRTAVSKKNGPAIDENLKALCKYDSFIETIEKSFDKNAILDELIDTKVKLASDEVERSPDYQKSYQMQILEKLIDAFTENFLMDNFSEQEVSLFYQTYHQKLDEEIKHIHTLLKNEDQKEAKSQQKLESQLAEILSQKESQGVKQLPPNHENNL